MSTVKYAVPVRVLMLLLEAVGGQVELDAWDMAEPPDADVMIREFLLHDPYKYVMKLEKREP